jgi:nucleoid DNA-binding protein
VESLLEIMKKFLEADEYVMKGRNPATGKIMILASRRVVSFTCSSKLRTQIYAA